MFSLKKSSGHLECRFENPDDSFLPEVRKRSSQTLIMFTNLTFSQKYPQNPLHAWCNKVFTISEQNFFQFPKIYKMVERKFSVP